MCSKPDGPPREFPFRNNMEEHMTKEHNHQWTKRDKYDPLEEKPISFRVKQAAKFCVVPKVRGWTRKSMTNAHDVLMLIDEVDDDDDDMNDDMGKDVW